ncbi:hypothetical protein ACWXVL_02960 [Mycoplasma sp. 128]
MKVLKTFKFKLFFWISLTIIGVFVILFTSIFLHLGKVPYNAVNSSIKGFNFAQKLVWGGYQYLGIVSKYEDIAYLYQYTLAANIRNTLYAFCSLFIISGIFLTSFAVYKMVRVIKLNKLEAQAQKTKLVS